MAFRDGPFDTIKVPLVWTAAVVVVVDEPGALDPTSAVVVRGSGTEYRSSCRMRR